MRAGTESDQAASTRPLVLGLVALSVALCRVLAVHSFPIYDDAFITFRYARNLAEGDGLVFNPGAEWEPVLGTTTPGYAVLLAFFARLGADIVRASIAFNVVCDCASAVLMVRLLGGRVMASAVAIAAFGAVPEIARVSVGGMEAPLLLALALGATVAARSSWLALAGLLAALACAIRPEGALLVLLLAAFHVRSLGQAKSFFTPIVLSGALYAGALSWYFGDPIPQSIKAKAVYYGLGPRLARAGNVLAQAFGPSWPAWLLSPLALLGFVLAFAWKSATRAVVAFGLGMVVAYAASGTKTWGWYFYVPLAAWCIALGLACDALFDFAARARPQLARRRNGLAIAAIVASVVAVVAWSRAKPDRVSPLVYGRMSAWCRAERVAVRGKDICASDIGAIGYFSGARILDSEGLVWPAGRVFDRQVDVVREHLPEYVMVVANQARTSPFVEDSVAARYELVARFNTRDEPSLALELAALPDRWEQDYLMFRRLPSVDD